MMSGGSENFYSGRSEDNTSSSRETKERISMLFFQLIKYFLFFKLLQPKLFLYTTIRLNINQVLGRNQAIDNYFTHRNS